MDWETVAGFLPFFLLAIPFSWGNYLLAIDGKPVKAGSQTGRRGSQATSGPTSLHEFAKAAGVEGQG